MALAGALALPAVPAVAGWHWPQGHGSVLLHDPSLAAGRRFAAAGRAAGGRVLALEGDPIRLAQRVSGERPALIAGVSRHAAALLFEEAAAEAGFVRVAALDGLANRCIMVDCRDGWQAVGRLVENAGEGWIEALAGFAARPNQAPVLPASPVRRLDAAANRAVGWVLARTA